MLTVLVKRLTGHQSPAQTLRKHDKVVWPGPKSKIWSVFDMLQLQHPTVYRYKRPFTAAYESCVVYVLIHDSL